MYDASGNKVLSISNGYINGCRIVDGTDFVGGYPEPVFLLFKRLKVEKLFI